MTTAGDEKKGGGEGCCAFSFFFLCLFFDLSIFREAQYESKMIRKKRSLLQQHISCTFKFVCLFHSIRGFFLWRGKRKRNRRTKLKLIVLFFAFSNASLRRKGRRGRASSMRRSTAAVMKHLPLTIIYVCFLPWSPHFTFFFFSHMLTLIASTLDDSKQ